MKGLEFRERGEGREEEQGRAEEDTGNMAEVGWRPTPQYRDTV